MVSGAEALLGDEVGRAAAALSNGEVVGLPTDTVYGLGVLARLPEACARLFCLKERPPEVALPVLVADLGQALEVADGADRSCRGLDVLARAFWPGPLTVIVRRAPGVLRGLGGDPSTVGLRCPAHPFVQELARLVGPLAVTSANRHGDAPCVSAAQVRVVFGAAVTTVVDGGRCDGLPSTVVSLVGGEPTCVREGALALDSVLAALG
ncbi:MAG TPA: L-threonylcarbamoyladenylate synthase [Acidimicrobiales bacterium]|nr:L-threonylcarbamoyladenylate synthase [Acidimicrobiales bacterium]